MDKHIIGATANLPIEFLFNLDYNSGHQLGIATKHALAPPLLQEIILPAGAIGTPHILLHSGIGDNTELALLGITTNLNFSDVAKHLSDHVRWDIPFTVNDTTAIENVYFRNPPFQRESLAEWQSNGTGFLTTGLINQLRCLRNPNKNDVWHEETPVGNATAHYEL
ncbi:hypothetical protein EDD18DRAFT_1441081 [Armillaria luteobubalina]|uniref:Glucose-methanol-choline oxidoreductase N-terminal domain-containing protein n=1 Tax=Armillaria luteobubalina TaxID=153913 RepID=A0AA39QCL5_9AGAR|nr:hypothetical protein EDD18DRAFT_1441081 [Armillaria luteobubalina]